jgi:glycine cleavage system H protein
MSYEKPSPARSARTDHPIGRAGRVLGTLPAGADACIWMRARVIAYKLCERKFACEQCLLDTALRGDTASPSRSEQSGAHEAGPGAYRLYPRDRRFGAGHTWVHVSSENPARVGIDAVLAWLVGEVELAQLAPTGAWLDRGDTIATLRSDGAMIKIRTPIPGRVLVHNDGLASCPELVVAAPYGAGWLADLDAAPERPSQQWEDLMTGGQMEKLAQTDLHRFHRRVDAALDAGRSEVGSTMADGGAPAGDLRAMLGSARFLDLVREIFT